MRFFILAWTWPAAAILACILWGVGFRKRVFRRNLELMGWKDGAVLRWRLCFHAAHDLLLLFSGFRPRPRLNSRSLSRLRAMRSGPCVLLTAHFHNWEALGSLLRREGVSLLAAARPLRAPWADRLLRRLRRRIDVATVSESVPRAALRHLDSGGCFALLWDQHAQASENSGRFFGVSVRVNPLPLFLLKHRPCPVYFGVVLPGGELRLISMLSRDEGDGEEKLARRYHRVLETLVRRHPGFWYGFFHARFKNIAHYAGHRVPVSGPKNIEVKIQTA